MLLSDDQVAIRKCLKKCTIPMNAASKKLKE